MSTELSVLLWDGAKSLPSEQPSASYNYFGTDASGVLGWWPVSGAISSSVLPHKIYVGTCEPSTVPNGSIAAPFADLPDAISYLAGRGEQWVEIHISSGEYNGVDFPAGKTIALISDSGGVFISHSRFTADGSGNSRFIGRNLLFQSLDTNIPSSGSDIYNVKLEDCVINEGVGNSGACDLRLALNRVSIATETYSTLMTATDSQFVEQVATQLLKATGCTFPESLKLYGPRAEFYGCLFPIAATTIIMMDGTGNERCYFDKASAVAFAAIDGDVSGGEPESQYDGPWLIRTDGTFSDGQCARLRTPILVRPCTGDGLDSSDMIGIVSPAQPTANRLALVWGHGRVPLSGLPDRPLYRDGSGLLVPFSSIGAGRYTQRVGQYNGDAIYLQIGEEIMA